MPVDNRIPFPHDFSRTDRAVKSNAPCSICGKTARHACHRYYAPNDLAGAEDKRIAKYPPTLEEIAAHLRMNATCAVTWQTLILNAALLIQMRMSIVSIPL